MFVFQLLLSVRNILNRSFEITNIIFLTTLRTFRFYVKQIPLGENFSLFLSMAILI
jgi:hypothetical protein